ncbi:MAG TPA: GNVR domain-containing protein [Candidatus Eisenbacteria bacterium]|nr:GNVR domain-containing protein [Candidatus Eisenbacteria bacterium]
MNREPTPSDYISSAKPYFGRATIAVVVGTILAAVLAFVWPPVYRGETVLLPPTEEETGFNVSSVIRGLNVPGIRIPSRTGPEDVTMAILQSRRIAATLVKRFDLMKVYKAKREEAAIRQLQDCSSFKLGESGTVVVRVEDGDPKRAADLANAYAEELDRFNREIRMTKGRRTRLFVEQRLEETRVEMEKGEEALRRYGEKHHTVALSSDQLSSVESGARLFATQATLEVELGVARQYASDESAEVRRLRQQLNEVNRLIGALPDLGLELARLVRTVKIQEQVFALLSAQYEEARIVEARDVSTVEVLDRAEPPDRKIWPRRSLLILLGFAISSFAATGWIAWNVRGAGGGVRSSAN